MCGEKKFAQKMFIFAQFLEKFAQKQNMPTFWKNLPNFQKLPNTCSPATDCEFYLNRKGRNLWHEITTTFHWCPLQMTLGKYTSGHSYTGVVHNIALADRGPDGGRAMDE